MEYDIWLWQDIAYHWRTCLFRFLKTTPDFKHHQNKLAQLYLPYLYSQQLRLGSSICNPRNFQVHWQDICITNRFKLKRTLIFKLGTTWNTATPKCLLAPTNVTTGKAAMTPVDTNFGVAVFHEPRINPQAHGILLYHFCKEGDEWRDID